MSKMDFVILGYFTVFSILTLYSNTGLRLYIAGIGMGVGFGLALVYWIMPAMHKFLGIETKQEAKKE